MKRFLALFLALVMFVCVIPASGASFSGTDSENYSIDNCPADYGRYTTYWRIG